MTKRKQRIGKVVMAGLLAWVCSMASASTAQAQLLQGAPTSAPGAVSLGVAGSFIFQPSSEFQGLLQLKVGVLQFMDVEVRAGIGSVPWLISSHVKFLAISSEILDLAFRLGYRYQSGHFIELGIPVSKSFDLIEIYFSPEFVLSHADGLTRFGFGVIPGMNFSFGKRVRLYVEFLIATRPLYSSGTLGLRFFF